MEELLKIVGEVVVYGGGVSAITYGALRWFGKRWFEHHFNQRLEEFRRRQTEILEETRYEIDKRFDRVTKIHEKEFEVLPEAWRLLQNAYGKLISVASPLQSWPNLNRYSEEELEAFLDNSGLHDFQKEELREADDKLQYYQEKAYWLRLNEARQDLQKFRDFIRHNNIFISSDLSELFSEIESVMIKAEVELGDPPENPWRDSFDTFQNLKDEMSDRLDDLEERVQERLHFEE